MALRDFEPLILAANQLLLDANRNPAAAERLLEDPKSEIEKAAGQPIPTGVILGVRRGLDQRMHLSVAIEPGFEGEIDDWVLEAVSGGTA